MVSAAKMSELTEKYLKFSMLGVPRFICKKCQKEFYDYWLAVSHMFYCLDELNKHCDCGSTLFLLLKGKKQCLECGKFVYTAK